MPVTITIGEKIWNEEIKDWDVERDNHPDAPVFENDETLEPLSNWRYVNVPVWRSMAQECGIEPWLIDLMETDVVRPLTEEHYRIVNEAYLLRSAFREGQPGWDAESGEDENVLAVGELPNPPAHDEYLARLMWLRFWIRWALDNCKEPSVMVSW